jgi:hypothetical protein
MGHAERVYFMPRTSMAAHVLQVDSLRFRSFPPTEDRNRHRRIGDQ